MNSLAIIMLLFWVPLTIFLFKRKEIHVAILLSYIGGFLLLPPGRYLDLPLINLNKNASIALGIILGEALSNKKKKIKYILIDYIMIFYCLISPVLTSITNGFGFYEGLKNAINTYLTWGIAYITGRKYFVNQKDLEILLHSMLIGVLTYLFPTLYEIKMSPQLCIKLYGYFPHSWIQHFRYDGYRPIVFTEHGLMVSLWIAIGVIILFWEWRSKRIKKLFHIPISLIWGLNFLTLLLCKSKGALFLGLIGILSWYIYKSKNITKFLFISIAFFPIYFIMRLQHFITVSDLTNFAAHLFDAQRIESFTYRLDSEEMLINAMGRKILLGWHYWGRGLELANIPVTHAVDSLWIIMYASRGLLALISIFSILLTGPLLILNNLRHKYYVCLDSIILSIIILLFAFDCLSNSMINVIYILCSGSLISYAQKTNSPNSSNGISSVS